MRTRTRTEVYSSVVRAQWPNASYRYVNCANVSTPTTATLGSMDYPSVAKEESISDNQHGKGKLNKVIHRSRKWDFSSALQLGALVTQREIPGVCLYDDVGTAAWQFRLAYLNIVTQANGLSAFNTTTGPVPASTAPDRWSIGPLGSINEDSLKEDCFVKARELKADVLQDIIEYNQVWPGIKSMATALPIMKATWPRLRRVFKTANVNTVTSFLKEYSPQMSALTRSVSGGYLAYKFGVLPVLMDLLAINRYLPKMADDLRRHADGVQLRFSSKAECTCAFNSAVWQYSENGYPTTLYYPAGRVITPPTVRYVLIVRPNLKFADTVLRKQQLFMQRFSTSPAKLAWDLIPFSFVADWFVDMRGLLRAIDDSIGYSPYEVVGLTRSFTYKLNSSFRGEWRKSCVTNSVEKTGYVGDVEFTHYERIPVSFAPSRAVWKPRFGKNQAAIAAALITQQLHNIGDIH